MTRIHLRPGKHLAVTWGIADQFGGMTGALLHRSRAFVTLGGVDVDVVTFDLRPDYPAVEERLRASGGLIDGMRLVNLWDWLCTWQPAADAQAAAAGRAAFTPLAADPSFTSSPASGRERTRTRFAEDGTTVLQVDHYRADGSLAVSDRRDVRRSGISGGRSIVWCDSDGVPRHRWKRAHALYIWWLDRLRENTQTTLIVDSKTSARFLLGYRRRGMLTFHVVHASHLQSRDPLQVRQSRAEVFSTPRAFDRLVFLTERQRSDARMILAPDTGTAVIPNARDVSPTDAAPAVAPRKSGRGIVLASLEKRKRVDHAVRAVAAAQTAVSLDIFGDGPERARVERAAAGAPDVTLHGYRSDASEHLATSSFLLLTSRSEGLPLVLVESMANGCIPIAYDIPYGPADIIRSGHNGFLIPAGDVTALTAAIDALVDLPADQVARLRRNAARTAARFTDEAVTARWAREIDRAAMQRGFLPAAPARALAFRLRRGIARRVRRLRESRHRQPATIDRHQTGTSM
ncbi:poly(glycerol-phosphate) alpha-glucosyltransferase [Mycetocola sp. CAN_C7]